MKATEEVRRVDDVASQVDVDAEMDGLIAEALAIADQRNVLVEELKGALLADDTRLALRCAARLCGIEAEWNSRQRG